MRKVISLAAMLALAACGGSSSPTPVPATSAGGNNGGGNNGGGNNGGGNNGGAATSGTSTGGASSTGSGGTTGVSQQELYQSGSRLKMKALTTADGAVSFYSWHDSQLQLDCTFANASDGQMRCLPILGAPYVGTFFSDPGCQVPLAYGGCTTAQVPPYAYAIDNGYSGTCLTGAPRYHAYPVIGVYSGSVYAGTPSSCNAQPTSTTSLYTFYGLSPEADASQFVAGTFSIQ